MLFTKKYSDLNPQIQLIEKPKQKYYGVTMESVNSIYKERNKSIIETNNRERYNGDGSSEYGYYFIAFVILCFVIGAFANNELGFGFLFLIGFIVFCLLGYNAAQKYKEKVSIRLNKYKQMNIFD